MIPSYTRQAVIAMLAEAAQQTGRPSPAQLRLAAQHAECSVKQVRRWWAANGAAALSPAPAVAGEKTAGGASSPEAGSAGGPDLTEPVALVELDEPADSDNVNVDSGEAGSDADIDIDGCSADGSRPAAAPSAGEADPGDAVAPYMSEPAGPNRLRLRHLATIASYPDLRSAYTDIVATEPGFMAYTSFCRHMKRIDRGVAACVQGTGGHRALLGRRMYLGGKTMCRNERWQMDSQEIPVHVIPARGTHLIKMWQVTAVDEATRMITASIVIPHRPTGADVAACIAQGVNGRVYIADTGPGGTPTPVFVGGIPDSIVWDNGGEFINGDVGDLEARLAFLGTAVAPYEPWRKGKIESWHATAQREVYDTLPGASHGPRNFKASPYWDSDRDQRLTADMLVAQAQAWIDTYNTDRPHGSLSGRTPLEAWANDPATTRPARPEQLWAAMMTTERTHTVNRSGVRHDNQDYVAPELNSRVGEKVTVRYLPQLPEEDRYLDLFDGDTFICRAEPVNYLTEEERHDILRERRDQAYLARRMQQTAARARARRQAEADAADFFDASAAPVSGLVFDSDLDPAADPSIIDPDLDADPEADPADSSDSDSGPGATLLHELADMPYEPVDLTRADTSDEAAAEQDTTGMPAWAIAVQWQAIPAADDDSEQA